MEYKVGDKVRIKPKFYFCTVDCFNNINMKDEFFNQYSRLPYCETVMTIGIVNKDFYVLKEDKWAYRWTDDMIECKVEMSTQSTFVETVRGYLEESLSDLDVIDVSHVSDLEKSSLYCAKENIKDALNLLEE